MLVWMRAVVNDSVHVQIEIVCVVCVCVCVCVCIVCVKDSNVRFMSVRECKRRALIRICEYDS